MAGCERAPPVREKGRVVNPLDKLPEEMDELVNSFSSTPVIGDLNVGITQYSYWMFVAIVILLTSALASVDQNYYNAAKVDGTSPWRIFTRITLPMISPTVFYLIITGFIGAFKEYSDAVALFGTDLNEAGMNTIVGYIYDMLYGNSGGYPSYASAAAILLFVVILTITVINLLVSRSHVYY